MKKISYAELQNLPLNTLVYYDDTLYYISGIFHPNYLCVNRERVLSFCDNLSTYCSCDSIIHAHTERDILVPESDEESMLIELGMDSRLNTEIQLIDEK